MKAERTQIGPETDEPGGREPAPGRLRLVQLFINSRDIEGGVDALVTPTPAAAWFRHHGLGGGRLRLTEADLARIVEFRELLRSIALANNGVPPRTSVVDRFNARLRALPLVAELTPSGFQLDPSGTGPDRVIGELAAIVLEEAIAGRWPRLKACARDACQWVYFDHSRSRTGKWCTMAICGSRTKMRTYYRRKRRTGGRNRSDRP